MPLESADCPIDRRRLIWVGPATIAMSVGTVWLVQMLSVALLRRSDALVASGLPQRQLEMLSHSHEPAVFTAVLVAIAVLVFFAVAVESTTPIRTYQRIAFAALLVSLVPDLLIGVLRLVAWPLAVVYMLMHVAAWAVTVQMLTRLTVVRRHSPR